MAIGKKLSLTAFTALSHQILSPCMKVFLVKTFLMKRWSGQVAQESEAQFPVSAFGNGLVKVPLRTHSTPVCNTGTLGLVTGIWAERELTAENGLVSSVCKPAWAARTLKRDHSACNCAEIYWNWLGGLWFAAKPRWWWCWDGFSACQQLTAAHKAPWSWVDAIKHKVQLTHD